MLSSKKPAQIPVFIAFFPLTTNSTANSGLKNNSNLIGTICFWNIDKEKQCDEIGFELMPGFRGKGIMQEAVQKIVNFGFECIQFKLVTAFVKEANENSIQLLKKNNFTRRKATERETAFSDPIKKYAIYDLSNPGL